MQTLLRAVAVFTFAAIGGVGAAQTFHTHPKEWKEPRRFHAALDAANRDQSAFVERVSIEPFSGSDGPVERVYSPNNAYFAACLRSGWPQDRAQQVSAYVRVHDERERGFLVELKDVRPQSCPEVRWVNEKLLFVRVWWGRVLGSDLLIDVEARKLMYHELVHEGWPAWQQHHGSPESRQIP